MKEVTTIISASAQKYDLRPSLVASIILQESAGKMWAVRHEPQWYVKHMAWRTRRLLSGYVPDPSTCNLLTEKKLRATSFGYMQILGETARSILKFDGDSLLQLCEPVLNIELGCRLLALNVKRAQAKGLKGEKAEFEALRLYNGSIVYPPQVLKREKEEQWRKLLS